MVRIGIHYLWHCLHELPLATEQTKQPMLPRRYLFWLLLTIAPSTFAPVGFDRFLLQQYTTLGSWALHYFPFFVMGRVLYFHHYYPCLLFGILNVGVSFDWVTKGTSGTVKRNACLLMLTLGVAMFCLFSPICYGMSGPISKYHFLKWLPKWL